MNKPLTQQRIRIRFGKSGALRFVGHLDLATAWERILRRARLPLEYTQGFKPRPRMQFAAALQVGVTSESEFLDTWLLEKLDGDFPGEWIARLQATSPSGLHIYDLYDVPIRGVALPTLVTESEFVIMPIAGESTSQDLETRAKALMAQDSIMRTGRKKPYDLRPRLIDITLDGDGNLIAQVHSSEHANARPDELLDAMGVALHQVRVHRRHLHLRAEA